MTEFKYKTWDEVEEGDVIAEFEMDITFRKVIQNVVATRDFFPGHHNPEYARAQGVENIYLNTFFYAGLIDRVVTDAFGPDVFIKRRKFRMLVPVPAESKIAVFGRVRRKFIINGKRTVLVDVSILRRDRHAQACVAEVLVEFPDAST